MNIASLINSGTALCATVSDSAKLDAQILLAYVLSKPHSFLRTWPDFTPKQPQIDRYFQLIEQRLLPTPIAYITGKKEFWSRDFLVNSSTLIPRPDTEILVEQVIAAIQQFDKNPSILELGTGTGCIAVSIKKECPHCPVTAVDISAEALAVAKQNATTHQADIEFFQSNWFSDIPEKRFDFIISNPPYIAQNDPHLHQGDVQAEPLQALASGALGLTDIKIIASHSKNYLNSHGQVFLEHGFNQAEEVKQLLFQQGYTNIAHHQDLQGINRITCGQLDF